MTGNPFLQGRIAGDGPRPVSAGKMSLWVIDLNMAQGTIGLTRNCSVRAGRIPLLQRK